MMKKNLFSILIIFCSGLSTSAFSQTNTPSPLSMSTILENLRTAGYTVCKEIEREDNQYETYALNAQGRPFKLEINPATGEVIPQTINAGTLSMLEAVQLIEQQGYYDITQVKLKKGRYAIEARNQENKIVELKIDATTGIVIVAKEWDLY